MLFCLTLVFSLSLLLAQDNVFSPSVFNQGYISSSLLNPYKLKVSHSMGFSAGTSSSGLGYYESCYTNHIKYAFNPKLNLELDLNFVNFGSTTSGKGISFESNDDNKTKVLPEFSLSYRPSDKVIINLEYKNYRNHNPWLGRNSDWME